MDIGKPRRVYRVEPVKEPVPTRRRKVVEPPRPVEPKKVPAR